MQGKSRQRTLIGIISMFAAEALLIPTGLITAVFLTRYLGPADYGLFTLAAILIAWIQMNVTCSGHSCATAITATH